MSAPTNSELFPEIGKVVDETDKHDEPTTGDVAADTEDERPVQEVESLCMKCYEQVCVLFFFCIVSPSLIFLQGVTRLLLTSIPFFREVILMSFRCEHCGFQNNEIQSAGSVRRRSPLSRY